MKIDSQLVKPVRSFYKTSLDYTNPSKQELFKALEKMGWEMVSEGSYSLVFSNPAKSYILKVNKRPDPAFAKFAALARRSKNSHFPKISDMKRLRLYKNTYHIYLIEKLVPVAKSIAQNLADAIENIGEQARFKKRIITVEELAEIFMEPKIKYYLKRNPSLITASSLLGLKRAPGLWFDLHNENIMKRTDGTVVIIDPYI